MSRPAVGEPSRAPPWKVEQSGFCAKCGGLPNLALAPTVLYPRNAYGEVRYRYSCSSGDGEMDLTVGDIRELHRQIRTAEFGVYLDTLKKIRERLTAEVDSAPKASSRIAASVALHKLSREALEDAGIVERKNAGVTVVSAGAVKVIPGSIVERKLKERVQRRLTAAVESAAGSAAVAGAVVDAEVVR